MKKAVIIIIVLLALGGVAAGIYAYQKKAKKEAADSKGKPLPSTAVKQPR